MIKNIFKLIAILAISPLLNNGGVNAQTKAEPVSKTAEFQKKDGILLQKQFKDVGSMGTAYSELKLQVLSLVDLITKQKVEALVFSMQTIGSKYKDPEEIKTSIDADEISSLLKAINIIKNDILPKPVPSNYTEIIFTSREGFKAGVFVSEDKWRFFIQLNKYDSDSNIFMGIDKISELVSLINKSGLVK